LDLWDGGSGRGEEPGGAKVLRLIQIRLTTPILEKTRQPVKTIRRKRESQIRVSQIQSAFIRTHNETFSVVPSKKE
jgi:hypothetical protein